MNTAACLSLFLAASQTTAAVVCPETVPEHESASPEIQTDGNLLAASNSAASGSDSDDDIGGDTPNSDATPREETTESMGSDVKSEDGETDADIRARQLAAISSALKTLSMTLVPETIRSLRDAHAMPERTFEQQQAKASAIHEAQTRLAEQAALFAALKEALIAILQQDQVAADVKIIPEAFGDKIAEEVAILSGVFGTQIAEDVALLSDAFDGIIAEGVQSIINVFGEHIARDVETILDVFGERVARDVKFVPDLLARE